MVRGIHLGQGGINYSKKHDELFEGIVRNLKWLADACPSEVQRRRDGSILTAGKSGKVPPGQVLDATPGGSGAENFQYYYHPDHLGSTSYITDASGEVYQHMEYFAFGETFVEEHSNTDRTPYLFNGKELDEETGLYYYGARYYEPVTSVWLSVDPMAEKYPSWNPYSYAFNNPLKYIDPTGKEGEEITDPPKWVTDVIDWFNGDKNYGGSGWGHGLRNEIYKALGLDDKASSLSEVGILSMLQRDEVELEGETLNKITSDPDIVQYDSEIASDAKADPKYGKEAFSFTRSKNVQLGGDRAPGDMWEQLKDPLNPDYIDTWNVAGNELTWLVRSTKIKSVVSVSVDGKISVTHKFSDLFDLRPSSGRSDSYNTATKILGTLYHDIAGGNDQMRIKAKWTKTIK